MWEGLSVYTSSRGPHGTLTWLPTRRLPWLCRSMGVCEDRIEVPADISEDDATTRALESDRVAVHTAGKQVRRVIYVPGRLVNVVAS